MKTYTFTYTKKDFWEFCIRAWWDMRRAHPLTLLIIMGFLIIYAGLLKRFPYEILILYGILFFVDTAIFYYRTKKDLSFQEYSVGIENGVFISRSASTYHETPCSQISNIKEGRRLLMLGIPQNKKQSLWFIIPTRVFSSAAEQYDFIQNLKNTVYIPDDTVHEPEDFHFSLFVDEDKWCQIATESYAVFYDINRRNFKPALFRFLYGLLCYILAIWFFNHVLGFVNIFSALALFLCIALALLYSKMNPEKAIRKNLQKTTAQGNFLGDWNICFTASGISYSVAQKRNVSMPWSEFTLIAETEHAFYFIQKDNRRFIPVPKSCFADYEQAQVWVQYCQTKGLTPIQIKMPKYMPAPLFYVLFVFVFCLLLASGIWHGYRKSTPTVSDSVSTVDSPTAADSAISTDFPAAADSVPLEVQAETLRLLGLTVPDEVVDELVQADAPQGDIFREIIETFPYTYTWMLMSLGSPEYDENFEIIGYSEEVFWFDFEGWDIETDYIHILEGMAALAKGSAIDQVDNIRVDTTEVDWEEGSGTLTVLLDYNGKTLSYPMDVYYDWIDEDVLSIYNDLLQDTDSAERFYAIGDGGQGAIIFFCNDEWAKKFEKMTNITPEKCATTQ